MRLCKSGQIQNCCHPNALMTLQEYLMDYAEPATKDLGELIIAKELNNIPSPKMRNLVEDNLGKIIEGMRDFRI